jgi:hypothetical protein
VSAAEELTLAEVRAELHRLVALADTCERPKPDVINPPGHAMPGHEWRVTQDALPGTRPPAWIVRTVDDAETCDAVYVAQPDPHDRYEWMDRLDFACLSPTDARRLAVAILAAADRAEHLAADVPLLDDRRRA